MMYEAVVHNEVEMRYELRTAKGLALATYGLKDGVATFTHTKVPNSLKGQGIGSRLIGEALDDVRRRRLKVRPLCPFVRTYMDKHPETRDLLASD